MKKLNVYLSSPFLEFRDTREIFLNEIRSRSYLYDVTAMENYRAEDEDALEKCIDDVNKCNIYVLILGDNYGTLAKRGGVRSGKSFTYWEYHTAIHREKEIETLIMLKTGSTPDEDPLLKEWKKEIAESQILTVY